MQLGTHLELSIAMLGCTLIVTVV